MQLVPIPLLMFLETHCPLSFGKHCTCQSSSLSTRLGEFFDTFYKKGRRSIVKQPARHNQQPTNRAPNEPARLIFALNGKNAYFAAKMAVFRPNILTFLARRHRAYHPVHPGLQLPQWTHPEKKSVFEMQARSHFEK